MICTTLGECVDKQLAGGTIETCMNHGVKCIESSDTRPKVKCEERKKKYVLENTLGNHVISYRMDGGIVVPDKSVSTGVCKCDYLLVSAGTEKNAVLVELKGVDVPHSLEQIQGTLQMFKEFFLLCSHVYARIIIASSTPKIKASPKYVKLEKMLRKTFGGNLKIVEKQFQEKDVLLDSFS